MNPRPTLSLMALCVLACPLWAQASPAQGVGVQGLILPTLHLSSDSDNMHIAKAGGGLLYRYTHAQHYSGVVWEHQRFRQTGDTALTGQHLSWVSQHIDPTTALGYQLKAGYSTGPTRGLFTFDASWALALSPRSRVEWFTSRDRVDAMAALQHGTHYTLAGGALDYNVHPRLTSVASWAHTQFSDSTDRKQLRLRLIWDAVPQHGITLQLLHKNQWGDTASTGYFNPERLQEHMAAIGWRQRVNGWLVAARLSAGQQQVNQGRWEPARLSALELTSPASTHGRFKLRLGEQHNWDVSGPNYRYRSLELQWVMPL